MKIVVDTNIVFSAILNSQSWIHLNCKLWTGDKALIKALTQKGYKRFIDTKELIEKLKK